MQAIAFTGLARSGKDTAADYLVERYGFHKLVLSEAVLEELKRQGKPPTKMNRSLFIEQLRKKGGKDILARKVVAEARQKKWEKAVFTGVHQLTEAEYFKKNLEEFHLVAVKAASEKRFGRRTGLDAQAREKFFERDRHDMEKFELGKVIGMAGFTIENNGTIKELQKKIDFLMEEIRIKKQPN